MPHTKSSALLKSASNNLDMIECKRQLQHPFVSPIKKEYIKGKLITLEGVPRNPILPNGGSQQ
jgi:hypothetical protein